MQHAIEKGVQQSLDRKIMSLLVGHKNFDGMPEAINVLTFLETAKKG